MRDQTAQARQKQSCIGNGGRQLLRLLSILWLLLFCRIVLHLDCSIGFHILLLCLVFLTCFFLLLLVVFFIFLVFVFLFLVLFFLFCFCFRLFLLYSLQCFLVGQDASFSCECFH